MVKYTIKYVTPGSTTPSSGTTAGSPTVSYGTKQTGTGGTGSTTSIVTKGDTTYTVYRAGGSVIYTPVGPAESAPSLAASGGYVQPAQTLQVRGAERPQFAGAASQQTLAQERMANFQTIGGQDMYAGNISMENPQVLAARRTAIQQQGMSITQGLEAAKESALYSRGERKYKDLSPTTQTIIKYNKEQYERTKPERIKEIKVQELTQKALSGEDIGGGLVVGTATFFGSDVLGLRSGYTYLTGGREAFKEERRRATSETIAQALTSEGKQKPLFEGGLTLPNVQVENPLTYLNVLDPREYLPSGYLKEYTKSSALITVGAAYSSGKLLGAGATLAGRGLSTITPITTAKGASFVLNPKVQAGAGLLVGGVAGGSIGLKIAAEKAAGMSSQDILKGAIIDTATILGAGFAFGKGIESGYELARAPKTINVDVLAGGFVKGKQLVEGGHLETSGEGILITTIRSGRTAGAGLAPFKFRGQERITTIYKGEPIKTPRTYETFIGSSKIAEEGIIFKTQRKGDIIKSQPELLAGKGTDIVGIKLKEEKGIRTDAFLAKTSEGDIGGGLVISRQVTKPTQFTETFSFTRFLKTPKDIVNVRAQGRLYEIRGGEERILGGGEGKTKAELLGEGARYIQKRKPMKPLYTDKSPILTTDIPDLSIKSLSKSISQKGGTQTLSILKEDKALQAFAEGMGQNIAAGFGRESLVYRTTPTPSYTLDRGSLIGLKQLQIPQTIQTRERLRIPKEVGITITDVIQEPGILKIPQIPGIIQEQPRLRVPITTQTTETITINPPYLPPYIPSFPTKEPPFYPIIDFGFGGFGKPRRRTKLPRQPLGYNPSLTAAMLGITGRKPRGLGKGILTGFEFRPILKTKKGKLKHTKITYSEAPWIEQMLL